MHKIIGKKITIELWVYFVPNLFHIHPKKKKYYFMRLGGLISNTV